MKINIQAQKVGIMTTLNPGLLRNDIHKRTRNLHQIVIGTGDEIYGPREGSLDTLVFMKVYNGLQETPRLKRRSTLRVESFSRTRSFDGRPKEKGLNILPHSRVTPSDVFHESSAIDIVDDKRLSLKKRERNTDSTVVIILTFVTSISR